MSKPICYICSSVKHVDSHHVDCREGTVSPETVPLCRRCHRTYHDLGVEWFEDDYLDKAIEIENSRRRIVYASLKDPAKPLELMTRDDVRRSAYWYEKHGITNPDYRPKPKKDKVFPSFTLPRGEPLCGWDWVNEHLYDLLDWVPRIEIVSPALQVTMDIDDSRKLKEAVRVIRGLKKGIQLP